MSEPIDINEKRMERGEQLFMGCGCGSEDGWHVLAAHTTKGPVISALICAGCTEETPVLWGIVKE